MDIYTKICIKCNIEKSIIDFFKSKRYKDGYQNTCKNCHKEYQKKYKEANRERLRIKEKEVRHRKKDSYKKYREAHKEKNKIYQKQYYQDNKEKALEYRKEYYRANKDKAKENNKVYQRHKRASDETFALIGRLRCLIGSAIRNNGYSKKSRTYEILGCSYQEFKVHMESQFTDGMSWENRSEWHIDHKIPLSWGVSEEEILALNHYTNLQPLWGEDNLSKGNRFSS